MITFSEYTNVELQEEAEFCRDMAAQALNEWRQSDLLPSHPDRAAMVENAKYYTHKAELLSSLWRRRVGL